MGVIACFVTGTDTGVGKTLVASGFLKLLSDRGLDTAGYKPIAAGCEVTADGLRSADALSLIEASTLELGYEEVNPVALESAIAPHIAALDEEVSLEIGPLVAGYQRLAARADAVIVEGAGGWRVPLGGGEDMGDLATVLDLPVVLVVGVRLGCLNHALMTAESIVHSGLELAGWVANMIDPTMQRTEENLATLEDRLPAPCLGRIPNLDEPDAAAVAPYLDPGTLLTGRVIH